MTVCIGTLCEDREAVVLVSDRMWTEQSTLYYEFEPNESKIEKLTSKAAVATSGGVVLPDKIIKTASRWLAENEISSIEDIAKILSNCFNEERRRRIDEEYFRPRNLTIDEFYNGKISMLPPQLAQFLDERVANYNFELLMILGGVDNDGGHLFLIRDPGTYESVDKVGFISIGTGGRHAELTLIQHDFRPTVNLSEALFLTYMAKKSAEHAPGVGQKTDIVVITRDYYFEIKDGDEILSYLDDLYSNLLDKIQKATMDIMKTIKKANELLKK